MVILDVVLGFLSYGAVGAVMSVVLAALCADANGKVDPFIPLFGGIFWPFALIACAAWGITRLGAPFGRWVHRVWLRAVRRLNPAYKGWA